MFLLENLLLKLFIENVAIFHLLNKNDTSLLKTNVFLMIDDVYVYN